MSTDRWSRVRELFEAALELPAASRAGLVRARAGDETELADEVLSLLASHAGAAGFLEGSALGPAGAGTAHEAPSAARLGPWRIVGAVGQGGMGDVFLGARATGGFEQRVAIKLMRQGLASEAMRRRFLAECQILAGLEHANIARLYDGGTSPDGVPFVVMEYVEGESLLAHCDARKLSIERRLQLFVKVCEAVQFAHRHLVVHRDLKPSNILVTAEGEPKLLDFGIAKTLGAEGRPRAADTVTSMRWMTPEYASPEQILGRPVTTASDVYSLGVVLYELVCGRKPYRRRLENALDLERAVVEEEAERPSTAVSRGEAATDGTPAERIAGLRGVAPSRLARLLRGDLDNILLKALEKDPDRRYASATELGDDLRRSLSGLPIRAREASARYRAAKFVRRHRMAVMLGAAAATALVVALALALANLARARRAETSARAEAATAEGVSEFLIDLFKISDPGVARGNAVTARELLDRGAARVGEQLSAEPAIQARMLSVIGRAYGALGIYDASAGAHEAELAAQRELHGDGSPEVASALTALAVVESRRGNYAEALAKSGEAVRRLEGNGQPERVELARALEQQGIAHWYLGDLEAASRAMERSLAVRDRLPAVDDAERVGTLNNAAILRWQLGDLQAARELYERALELVVRVHGAEHPDVASTLNNFAILEHEDGRDTHSRELHERALAMRRKLLAPGHPDIAESLNNLGEAFRGLKQLALARGAFEEALVLREKAYPAGHAQVATTQTNLGLLLVELGEAARARELLERSLAGFTASIGAEHFLLSYPLGGLAALEAASGNPGEAERLFRRALALSETGLGAQHKDTVELRRDLAAFLREHDREAEARLVENESEAPMKSGAGGG